MAILAGTIAIVALAFLADGVLRLAEQLTAAHPDTRYATLAVRGRLLRGLDEEQLEACLAREPPLVSHDAGGNDL